MTVGRTFGATCLPTRIIHLQTNESRSLYRPFISRHISKNCFIPCCGQRYVSKGSDLVDANPIFATMITCRFYMLDPQMHIAHGIIESVSLRAEKSLALFVAHSGTAICGILYDIPSRGCLLYYISHAKLFA